MHAATLLGSRRAVAAAMRVPLCSAVQRALPMCNLPRQHGAVAPTQAITCSSSSSGISSSSSSSASSSSRQQRQQRPLSRRLQAAAVEVSAARPAPPRDTVITSDPANNVSDYIYGKMGANLHLQPDHPLCIIKNAIYAYFDASAPGTYRTFDDLPPVVSATANFDEVLVPADHVSRSPNDTYYVDGTTVLRCHTSAHQAEMLRSKHAAFLVTGEGQDLMAGWCVQQQQQSLWSCRASACSKAASSAGLCWVAPSRWRSLQAALRYTIVCSSSCSWLAVRA